MQDKNEIIIFENQKVKLEVNLQDETVWLSQAQMVQLFGRDKTTISRHINNIFDEGELNKNSVVAFFATTAADNKTYSVEYYNLDVIISVGYRVKSPQGTQFRIWANKVLKDYMLKGVAINQKRLEMLEKTVKLLEIANRDQEIEGENAKQILQLINHYYRALDTLESYDEQRFSGKGVRTSDKMITYKSCLSVIAGLKYKQISDLFGSERERGLESILGNVYQSFGGQDVYPTLEEKAANLFYLLIKNHPFSDGNKRIAATLLIYFLDFYGMLYRDGLPIINNIALTSLTLLIAQSNPREKDLMVALVVELLGQE
ncbi:virulence protein RhuM/Fic/DOC family protein [bacterium]|nr:virulence protein RhuM/Fic/DOC family protein [bacterium]